MVLPYDFFHSITVGELTPPLLGLAEVAEAIGWDKRKLVTYVKRGVFPEPALRLASGPLWTRWQVDEYRQGRWKKPPRKKRRRRVSSVAEA
jgi:hypothetical protein